MDLEQKRVRPGHWLIEGWTVIRCKRKGRTRWHGYAPGEGGLPVLRFSLDDMRDHIRDWLDAQRESEVHKHPSA